MVILAEDRTETGMVTRVDDRTGMVAFPMGLETGTVVTTTVTGFQVRTECLGFQLFSQRVLELLAKYCEDFYK